ncbi:MAG TPA: hypothetical protein VGY54_07310 [Polyangiaceae bacterium]|nr:hypothetical protein [Polyangiaceae bacterium]
MRVRSRPIDGRGAAWLLALLAAGCSTNSAPSPTLTQPQPTISAEQYNRSCESVADCVVVVEGPVFCCGGMGCGNAVIGRAALPAYMSELTMSTKVACGAGMPVACHGGSGPSPGQCPQGRVACDDGGCVLETGGADGGASD